MSSTQLPNKRNTSAQSRSKMAAKTRPPSPRSGHLLTPSPTFWSHFLRLTHHGHASSSNGVPPLRAQKNKFPQKSPESNKCWAGFPFFWEGGGRKVRARRWREPKGERRSKGWGAEGWEAPYFALVPPPQISFFLLSGVFCSIVHRLDTVALLHTCFLCFQTHLAILPTHSRWSKVCQETELHLT